MARTDRHGPCERLKLAVQPMGSWRFGQSLGHQAEQGLRARQAIARRAGEIEKCHFRHHRGCTTRITGDAAATMAGAARQWAVRRRGHRARDFGPLCRWHTRLIMRAGLGRRCGRRKQSRNRRSMRTMRLTGVGLGRGRRETAGDQKDRAERPQQMNFRGHVEPYHDGSGSTNLVATIGKSTDGARRLVFGGADVPCTEAA